MPLDFELCSSKEQNNMYMSIDVFHILWSKNMVLARLGKIRKKLYV